MSEVNFIPKKIAVVIPNYNLRHEVTRSNGLLERLQQAGHEIAVQFDSYEKADEYFSSNPMHDIDTILVEKPDLDDDFACIKMLAKFDSDPSRHGESNYEVDASKIVISLGGFSFHFPDIRFRATLPDFEYTAAVHMPVDINLRTETRGTDYKIDPFELRNEHVFEQVLGKVGALRRGEHQIIKSKDFEEVFIRKMKEGKEVGTGDTPVIYR